MTQNQYQCMRPCHDCPFRKDIKPWQTAIQIANNVDAVLNTRRRAVCHHTVLNAPEGRALDADHYDGKKLTCAGFLLMRQKTGVPLPPGDVPVKDRGVVFDSLEDFARRAAKQ